MQSHTLALNTTIAHVKADNEPHNEASGFNADRTRVK
jgi:hypothetical protein